MKAPNLQIGRSREQLAELGRRLVAASQEVPRDALHFLGDLPLTQRGGPPGSSPGSMALPADGVPPTLRAIVYGPDSVAETRLDDLSQLQELLETPDTITWIDVAGFGDGTLLTRLGEQLGIHALAMADVVHVPQRPKAELHDGRMLVVTQMARVTEEGNLDIEQVSLVMGPGWVVSFQERSGDVFDPVRERIRGGSSRIRRSGADYLLYALVDAVIDGYFPVVEALAGIVDALEEEVIQHASRASLARIHATRRTLLTLHRVQWRQRDAVNAMLRDDQFPFSPEVRPFLRDAHDHAFQTLDAIETFRDMVVGLMDLHLSSASHRMNEVMKTLTIVATIFIPLTFVAGIYGMNFDAMPELHWKWGYPTVMLAMLGIAVGLVYSFRRRGWIGTPSSEREP